MTPEQIANMQAGRKAVAEARKAEQASLVSDEDALSEERHQRAYADLLRLRAGQPGWE